MLGTQFSGRKNPPITKERTLRVDPEKIDQFDLGSLDLRIRRVSQVRAIRRSPSKSLAFSGLVENAKRDGSEPPRVYWCVSLKQPLSVQKRLSSLQMVDPDPCKELNRRLHPFVVGTIPC